MDTLEKLKDGLEYNKGVITSEQAHLLGITNERMSAFAHANQIEKVARGIYVGPNTFVDEMYIAQLTKTKMIYSHETALHLHDLTDRDPLKYSVTVPSGYNSKTLLRQKFDVFSISQELLGLGKIECKTMYGNYVRCYNLERTICDMIRSKSRVDQALLPDALKRYVQREDKDLNSLMEMAEAFKIAKTIRLYMEVLL
ncbi:MAG TPA: abortive phage infection protein [Acidimicrobiia bacterium]|nr:abortive phage infection protein [Acidimicrobiia bacterium]